MKTWRGFWIAPALELVLGPYLTRFRGFPGVSDGNEADCNAGDLGLIPGLGRSPGEGNGLPLQYSCLENHTDRGAWQVTVCRVTKNQTWLSDSHTHTHTHTHTVSIHFCWIVCKGSLACVSYWVWVHFNSVQQDFILLSKLRKQPLSGTCCSHGKRKRIMSWLLKLLQGNVTSAHVSLVKQVTQPGLNSV